MPSIIKEENKRRDKSIKEDKDMKKNSKRRMFSALLILFLMIQMTVQADTGTKERVDLASKDTGSSVEELERQREEQQSQLDSLKEYQINLSDELTELNNGLQEISNELADTQDEIAAKNVEIEAAESRIAELTTRSESQYEAMKKRVQYMYENGNQSYLELLLGASSFSDFLNRMEYAKSIYDYDRQELSDYQDTLAELKQQKEDLETAKEELKYVENYLKLTELRFPGCLNWKIHVDEECRNASVFCCHSDFIPNAIQKSIYFASEQYVYAVECWLYYALPPGYIFSTETTSDRSRRQCYCSGHSCHDPEDAFSSQTYMGICRNRYYSSCCSLCSCKNELWS